VEFSPNSRYLYAGSYFVNEMHQFDVLAGSAAAVIASDTIVGTSVPSYGSLQLAPDGKIYFTEAPTYLGVINDPDNAGALCNYANNAIMLTGVSCALGLPNFFPSGLVVQNPPVINFVASDRYICPGSCIDFTNMTSGGVSYQWFFAGAIPDTSTAVNPAFICYNTPGNYSVTLIATNAVGSDTVTLNNLIHVYPQPVTPVITQVGNVLQATTGYVSYQWYYVSDTIAGATNSSYYGQLSGNYNLVVTDSNGCTVGVGILNVVFEPDGMDEFNVQSLMFNVYPNPVRNEFTVYPPDGGLTACEIEIYNSLGQKVYAATTINRKQETVNCKYFAEGIYVLQLHSAAGVVNKKFVVELH
jgi:PKD repeat protein